MEKSTPIWQLTVGQFIELLESQKVEPEAPKEEEEYLSPIEACEYLKVSKSTLARWRRSGYLTGNKVGGILRYKKSELQKII